MAKSTKDIKQNNTELVLKTLVKHGLLSRIELSQLTDLAPSTVSSITSDLIQNNVLEEVGDAGYTGGRRRVNLQFSKSSGFVLFIVILYDEVQCLIYDFNSNLIKQKQLYVGVARGIDLANLILNEFSYLIQNFQGDIKAIVILKSKDIPEYELTVEYSTTFSSDIISLENWLMSSITIPVYSKVLDRIDLEIQDSSILSKKPKSTFVYLIIGIQSLSYQIVQSNKKDISRETDFKSISYQRFREIIGNKKEISNLDIYHYFLDMCYLMFNLDSFLVDDGMNVIQSYMSEKQIESNEKYQIVLAKKNNKGDFKELDHYIKYALDQCLIEIMDI